MYASSKFYLLLLCICSIWHIISGAALPSNAQTVRQSSDLTTAETSAKLLNLGGLFGQSNGYPNYYRPSYGSSYPSYPSYSSYSGSYPSYGGSYPSYTNTGYGSYGNTGYGNGYYGGGSSSFYPSTGTNILGNNGYGYGYNGYNGYNRYPNSGGYGGYGGYGGNGGLRQYSGYWQPQYSGQRNRGYGYFEQSDRFGLPSRERDYYGTAAGGSGSGGYTYNRPSSYAYNAYRGYD